MTGESEAGNEGNLQSELAHLKGIMSCLVDTRSSRNAQHWKGEFESATSELHKVQQQLEEVSKRCSSNSAGTQSMVNGIQDLEKQVAVLPAESEHKLRLMSAQMQAAESRYHAEKSNLEHRLVTARDRMADMREQIVVWEDKFASETSRLSAERANQAANAERLQLELSELKSRLLHVSTERDNYYAQISKLQERLVQTEAAKGQLLTRSEALKDSEMERVRQLLAKANSREAELLSELQACRSARNSSVNEAQAEVQRLGLQLREAQETASRERDHLTRQLKKLNEAKQNEATPSHTEPSTRDWSEGLQRALTALSVRLQSSGCTGGFGSMVAAMATHVHAAGVILDSVSRHGDQVVWPDHPEHQTVKLVCEQLNRLDGHQNLVVELQAEVASVEAARQQELAESRVAWIQLEQQVALAQQRLSTTQSEAANERRSLLDRINQLEMRIRQDSPTMPEEDPPSLPGDETLVRLQAALKEAIAEQVQMAEECAKLEVEALES